MSLIDSRDGVYFLIPNPWDGDLDSPITLPPAGTVMQWQDIVVFRTFGEWSPVSLMVEEWLVPAELESTGWEKESACALQSAGGKYMIVDQEFVPDSQVEIELEAGSYVFQLFARSLEWVTQHGHPIEDPATEEHLIVFSRQNGL